MTGTLQVDANTPPQTAGAGCTLLGTDRYGYGARFTVASVSALVGGGGSSYTLPVATSGALGGVASGGDVTVNPSTGAMTISTSGTLSGVANGFVTYASNGTTIIANTPAQARAKIGLSPKNIFIDNPVASADLDIFWEAPFAGTVASLKAVTDTGTIVTGVKINGTAVTGTGLTASSTASTGTATAANTFAAGDRISLIRGSVTGSPTYLKAILTFL